MKVASTCEAASIKFLAVTEMVSISMLKMDLRFFSLVTAAKIKEEMIDYSDLDIIVEQYSCSEKQVIHTSSQLTINVVKIIDHTHTLFA